MNKNIENLKKILDELEYYVFDNLEDMYSEKSANYYQNKFKELRKLLDSSGDHIPRID